MRPKATRYLRVQFDISLTLDEEVTGTDGLVSGYDSDRVMWAILATLTGNSKIRGVAPGMRTRVSLDGRPRGKKGELLK